MKKASFASAALVSGLIFVAGPLWAQSDDPVSVDDVQAELSEAYGVIANYSAQQRDEAVEAAGMTLERIDDGIEALEQRARENWASMSEAARERTSETLQELRARRNELAEMYGAMRYGAADAWDDLVRGMTQAWEDLQGAWDAAVDDADSNSEQEG